MIDNLLIEKLDRPEELEEIYQTSPKDFNRLLVEALSQKPESETLKVWNARLSYSRQIGNIESTASIYFVIIISLFAGFMAKLPNFFAIPEDWFYPRFIPLVVIIPVILYFLRKASISSLKKAVSTGLLFCILYMLVLPHNPNSASITMSLIHMPLVLGTFLAIGFMREEWRDTEARLRYIRYIGELVIYTVLILLGGIVLTLLTFGLFGLIGLSIEKWYTDYIVVFGLVASPLVATYLYDSILGKESKLAAVLSNIFSPLFFITILAYLLATIYQGKSPYSDRDFLIVFNGLLLVIWAIAVFSISGKTKNSKSQLTDVINIALVTVTLLVNAVALSAIVYRWAEYGVTPNRVVVSGANLLIFANLVLLLRQYIQYIKVPDSTKSLESTIAGYLPLYSLWSIAVVVLLPLLFQYA